MTLDRAHSAGASVRFRVGRVRARLLLACFVWLWPPPAGAQLPVGDTPTARAGGGRELYQLARARHRRARHRRVRPERQRRPGDGATLDNDGHEDIVSVHESDSEYDSTVPDPDYVPDAEGHVRVAFGSADPDAWTNVTIAEGADAPAPEDAAIADVNGDGHLDVVVAAELSHLVYLQNPGADVRRAAWPRLILPMTEGRGSYIRVFLADLDGDGVPEMTAPNKGAQRPAPADFARSTPVSIFSVRGDPLEGGNWTETVLGRYSVPQNAEPVDIDGDGDLDIVVGTRGENRLLFFENPGDGSLDFREHAIGIYGARAAGFNLEYADLNRDGRLDIIGAATGGPRVAGAARADRRRVERASDRQLRPRQHDRPRGGGHRRRRRPRRHGRQLQPRPPREGDGEVDEDDALGRIGWFEHPGDAAGEWRRHDVSRRKRGMYDKFIARDVDGDGDVDFVGTRGNSAPYDGVFWLEQVRSDTPRPAFERARTEDSPEMPLPREAR